MNSKKTIPMLMFVSVLVASILACSVFSQVQSTPESGQPAAPVDAASDTPAPEPTETMRPTWTPKPTATPDAAATQAYDELFAQVQKFYSEGLIPTTNGEYRTVVDFKDEFSQIGWLNSTYLDFEVKHFVFMGHVKWSTAADTSDNSGCGVVFAVQKDNHKYGTILDKSRIYFTSVDDYYRELGKTRGTGRLDLGNPAEVDFTLLVFETHAYVYVDNVFIGEYSLSKDKPLRGRFGYGIISGTNKDYGTRCEITNARIWEILP